MYRLNVCSLEISLRRPRKPIAIGLKRTLEDMQSLIYPITKLFIYQTPPFPPFLRVAKVLVFSKKGPAEADPFFLQRTKDDGYLLSSTRDAIMLYVPALTKMRPRTRTVLAFTGVTFRLVPLTIETATVD